MNNYINQLSGLKHRQQLLYVLVFSFATILVWVAISLVSSQQTTQISSELKDLAKPLAPTINRGVLDALEKKRVYQPAELRGFPIYKLTVTPPASSQPTPSPTPTESNQSNPPTSTVSGTIEVR